MLKRKQTKKIQKPIDYDIHLKYRCSNCDQDHWLSYLESHTKNFKVVCDCGEVFKIKRVMGFDLKYQNTKEKTKKTEMPSIEKDEPIERIVSSQPVVSPSIPDSLLQSSISILGSFGYSKVEAFDMIKASYEKLKTDSVGDLVKFALANSK